MKLFFKNISKFDKIITAKLRLTIFPRIMHFKNLRTERESELIDNHHPVPHFNDLRTLWQAAVVSTILVNRMSQHRTESQKGPILKPFSNCGLT
jgi:hypothetical protein